jgi:hypothetical protein
MFFIPVPLLDYIITSLYTNYWYTYVPNDKDALYALEVTICENFWIKKFIFSFVLCTNVNEEN